jgi:hypothetical protein
VTINSDPSVNLFVTCVGDYGVTVAVSGVTGGVCSGGGANGTFEIIHGPAASPPTTFFQPLNYSFSYSGNGNYVATDHMVRSFVLAAGAAPEVVLASFSDGAASQVTVGGLMGCVTPVAGGQVAVTHGQLTSFFCTVLPQ